MSKGESNGGNRGEWSDAELREIAQVGTSRAAPDLTTKGLAFHLLAARARISELEAPQPWPTFAERQPEPGQRCLVLCADAVETGWEPTADDLILVNFMAQGFMGDSKVAPYWLTDDTDIFTCKPGDRWIPAPTPPGAQS